jgi:hypothetical protein
MHFIPHAVTTCSVIQLIYRLGLFDYLCIHTVRRWPRQAGQCDCEASKQIPQAHTAQPVDQRLTPVFVVGDEMQYSVCTCIPHARQ